MVLIGVNVLFLMDKISKSLTDLFAFQVASVVIALLAFCCFWYTGKYSPDRVAQCDSFGHLIPRLSTKVDDESDTADGHRFEKDSDSSFYAGSEKAILLDTPTSNLGITGAKNGGSVASVEFISSSWQITKEILRSWDFHRFVWMNFLHVCRSTAHMNFAAIFTERLIPTSILPLGSWRMSCFYGICAVVPQVSGCHAKALGFGKGFGSWEPSGGVHSSFECHIIVLKRLPYRFA